MLEPTRQHILVNYPARSLLMATESILLKCNVLRDKNKPTISKKFQNTFTFVHKIIDF